MKNKIAVKIESKNNPLVKNFTIVLKLLLKDMFKRREKKQKLIFIFLGIAYVFMGAMGMLMVWIYSAPFIEAGKSVQLVTMILFMDFVMTIIFGIITSISYIFMSKDIEFFKSLPIKQSTVFIAKLSVVYLTETAVSAIILVPALITAGVTLSMPALFYCLIPLFILSVPVFAFMIISIVALPFMYLISLFKNRSVASSIATILSLAVFFALYIYFMLASAEGMTGEESYDDIIKTSGIMSNILFPVHMLSMFAALKPIFGLSLAASMLAEMGIFLGALILMFALSYLLSSLIYNNITGKLLENDVRKKGKRGKHIASSKISALMKNEWRGVIRNPAVAMQVVSGVILCPIIVVMFCLVFVNTAQMLTIDELGLSIDISSVVWIFSIMGLLMFGVGTNAGSATCISREGMGINYLKGMPLEISDIIKAKRRTYIFIQGASIITGLIAMITIMLIYNSFIWWIPLGSVAVVFPWLFFMTDLSIYLDLKHPRLDWKSFREIIKRGKNNLVSMVWIFSSMILCFLLAMFVVVGIVSNVSVTILVGFLIMMALGLVAALIIRFLLNKNSEKFYLQLGN